MLSAAQLELRRSGIGSSDMAAVVGKSPFGTPFDVWLSKVEKVDQHEDFSRKLGRMLENTVLDLYQDQAKPEFMVRGEVVGTLRHHSIPWMLSTPDAIASFGTVARPTEAKTSRFGEDWGEKETDDVPTHYLIQCNQHLMVARNQTGEENTDIVQCDLPVLIRTDEFRIYRVMWEPELAGVLQQEGERFMRDYVITKKLPPIDGSRHVDGWLKRRFPNSNGQAIEGDAEAFELASQLKHAIGQAKTWNEREESLIAQLKLKMGEAEALMVGDLGKLVWKKNKDSQITEWKMLADSLLSKLPEAKRLQAIAAFTKTKEGNRPFTKKWATK